MPFKVVDHTFKIRRSSYVHDNLVKEYHPGVWTEADPDAVAIGYGLLYFEHQDDAVAYYGMLKDKDFEVWECEIGKTFEITAGFHVKPTKDAILASQRLQYFFDWTDGSRMTDKLKLTRRIK